MIGYLVVFMIGVLFTLYFTKQGFKQRVNKLILSMTPKSKTDDKKDEVKK